MAVKFDPILSAVREADTGTPGADGADGVGVPAGGTTDQVLSKIDATNYNTQWVTPASDAVSSVNGQTGAVVLGAGDVGAAPALGLDDNYVTDAQLVVIGNTSGTNTGDNATNSLYSGLAASKEDTGVAAGLISTHNSTYDHTLLHVPGSDDQDLSGYLTSATAASTYEPLKGSDDNFVTDAEKANLHAPGSDNQDLSGLVPYTGATGAVDVGANAISATNVTDAGVSLLSVINSPLPFYNYIPNSGRMAATQNPKKYQSPGAFEATELFNSYNGSSQASAGKFIYDNTTNGGTMGALTTPVQDLLTAMGRTGTTARYGVEFYVSTLTCGAGTVTAWTFTSGTKYLAGTNPVWAMTGLSNYVTIGFWIRCVQAPTMGMRNDLTYVNTWVDGVRQTTNVEFAVDTTSAGWHWVCRNVLLATGYGNASPHLYGNNGTIVEIALPVILPGKIYLEPLGAPVPNAPENGTVDDLTIASSGTLTMPVGSIITDTSTGLKIGTGTTQKIGFFNVTPVVQASAYTQTYSTAAKTVPAATASNPPAGGTGATAGAYDTAANRNAMITSLTNNIADVLALKKVVNALIDDLQAIGIIS